MNQRSFKEMGGSLDEKTSSDKVDRLKGDFATLEQLRSVPNHPAKELLQNGSIEILFLRQKPAYFLDERDALAGTRLAEDAQAAGLPLTMNYWKQSASSTKKPMSESRTYHLLIHEQALQARLDREPEFAAALGWEGKTAKDILEAPLDETVSSERFNQCLGFVLGYPSISVQRWVLAETVQKKAPHPLAAELAESDLPPSDRQRLHTAQQRFAGATGYRSWEDPETHNEREHDRITAVLDEQEGMFQQVYADRYGLSVEEVTVLIRRYGGNIHSPSGKTVMPFVTFGEDGWKEAQTVKRRIHSAYDALGQAYPPKTERVELLHPEDTPERLKRGRQLAAWYKTATQFEGWKTADLLQTHRGSLDATLQTVLPATLSIPAQDIRGIETKTQQLGLGFIWIHARKNPDILLNVDAVKQRCLEEPELAAELGLVDTPDITSNLYGWSLRREHELPHSSFMKAGERFILGYPTCAIRGYQQEEDLVRSAHLPVFSPETFVHWMDIVQTDEEKRIVQEIGEDWNGTAPQTIDVICLRYGVFIRQLYQKYAPCSETEAELLIGRRPYVIFDLDQRPILSFHTWNDEQVKEARSLQQKLETELQHSRQLDPLSDL